MKHTKKITLILITIFFFSQIVGLLITNQYLDYQKTTQTGVATYTDLPFDIGRPQIEESSSF